MKYINEKLNMRNAWKDFCLKLLLNIDKIEEETIVKDSRARNCGQTFSERKIYKDKLQRCKKYREIIKKSANEKILELQDGDEEVILQLGWDYYFKYMNCGL